MRHTLVLLLLIAALVHPVVHVDDPLVCPCAHGAVVAIDAPAVSGLTVVTVAVDHAAQRYLPVAVASEVPARAPPVA